jgi:hypothetical protein
MQFTYIKYKAEHIEAVARQGDKLVFLWREDVLPFVWHGPFDLANGVMGIPSLIQSRYGEKGDLEVLAKKRRWNDIFVERGC